MRPWVCLRKFLWGAFNQLLSEQIENSWYFPREQIHHTTPSSFQQIIPFCQKYNCITVWLTFMWHIYEKLKISRLHCLEALKILESCSELHFWKVTKETTQKGKISKCNRDPLHLFKWKNLLDSSRMDHTNSISRVSKSRGHRGSGQGTFWTSGEHFGPQFTLFWWVC